MGVVMFYHLTASGMEETARNLLTRYALDLAARGAKVVVNDLGGARDGSGGSGTAAQAVVDEIVAAGGEAMASGASSKAVRMRCFMETGLRPLARWSSRNVAHGPRNRPARHPALSHRHPARAHR